MAKALRAVSINIKAPIKPGRSSIYPLIIRTPGQQDSRTVSVTADQTALAPTILELAGQPRPDWLRGQSLVGWLDRNGQGAGEGLAFTQYLERNSIFKPFHHGTVGVIDGSSTSTSLTSIPKRVRFAR